MESVHTARAVATVDDMVMLALADLLDPVDESSVRETSPRGNPTKEIVGWSCTLNDVRSRLCVNPVRDIRKGYCAAKVTWDLMERDDPEPLLFWNPNGKWYIDHIEPGYPAAMYTSAKDVFYGESYGKRLLPQLRWNMAMLKEEADTRRAAAVVWQPADASASLKMKNVPCCLGWNLRVTDLGLESQVVMRSNSVGVLPYDLFLFSVLHELVANELNLICGPMHWLALSMHVYERELEQRKAEYDWYLNHDERSPQMRPLPFERLDDAAARWWATEQHVRKGNTVQMRDDVEALFWEGYPRG